MKTKFLKYSLILTLLLFSCKKTVGQNVNNLPSKDLSKNLEQLIPSNQKIENREEIDFDNDNENEIIITTSDINATTIFEYWFKNGKLLYKFSYPWVSINKKWFVNLDDDQQNEIIRAQGYEDGIDYAIYDLQNNRQIPLLYFNPLIDDSSHPNQFPWGYPSDIKEIVRNSNKEILVSLDNNYQREGEYLNPKNQKELPFVFFNGNTTQPDMIIKGINAPKYLSLKKILSLLNNQEITQQSSNEIVFQTVADLNNDKIPEKIEVVKNQKLKDVYDQSHFGLPINIYKGNQLWKQNHKLLPNPPNNCVSEGFSNVVVKKNYFTIEYQSCYDYNILVSAYVTFKVIGNEIYLYKYGENYFDKSNHEKKIPSKLWSEKDFKKIKFEDVSNTFLESLK